MRHLESWATSGNQSQHYRVCRLNLNVVTQELHGILLILLNHWKYRIGEFRLHLRGSVEIETASEYAHSDWPLQMPGGI